MTNNIAPFNIAPLPSGFVLHSQNYQYTIKDVLGIGSNGIVYLAEMLSFQDNTSCDVALKEWAPQYRCERMGDMSISHKNNLNSFFESLPRISEYDVLSKISHQNVVGVYEFISTNGTYYYSMEYLPGGTLLDKLFCMKCFNEEQSLFFIKQIAAGLEALHQRDYIHSDLQLKNIVFRNEDNVVLIDGGAYRERMWEYGVSQDIFSLANVLLCLLSGELNPSSFITRDKTQNWRSWWRSVYTQSEHWFILAKEKGNMTENTERAIRMAFSAEFQHVGDFVTALEGHFEPNMDKGQNLQKSKEDIIPNEYDSQKALNFLDDMEKMNDYYISKTPVDFKKLREDDKEPYWKPEIELLLNWFFNLQKDFVLSLRLLSPNEFYLYLQSHYVESSVYLTYDSRNMKFYTVVVEKSNSLWHKQDAKVEELERGYRIMNPIQNCKFYYACDRNPIIADSHKFYFRGQALQMKFDSIMPASPLGFCRVAKNGKWGMVSITGNVSLEIECKYDSIDNISEICVPGPGPGGPFFLGTIGSIGERTDFYELRSNGELHLKVSMTKAQMAARSHLT